MARSVTYDSKARTRKADKGHSIVRFVGSTDDYGFSPRLDLHCECGKIYTGQGMRAHASHERHQRDAAKAAA